MTHGRVEGIVISKINYSDTSIIVKLLTHEHGVMSFIFPGGKSKKKGGNLIQPLSVIFANFSLKPGHDLATVHEVEPSLIWRDISFNPYKSGILFFMNEVLSQTVREKEDSGGLFLFVKNALQILDLCSDTRFFPHVFLVQLLHYLGFYPRVDEHARYLDLREGTFLASQPTHSYFAPEDTSGLILSLMNAKLDGTNTPQASLEQRRRILTELINYYKVHFDHFNDLQSLPVLESTFHE